MQAALLALSVLAANVPAAAQQPKEATPQDAILARKAMMTMLSDYFDRIEAALAADKLDVATGKDQADTISVMLMAFPHLFATNTNLWKPGADLDPATDTFASPDVWSKFADFYQRTAAASKFAYDMSRAENDNDFKATAMELRAACNACHAAYLKQ
jgi:cytochrome c556